jgi:DNA mismatch repair protein MSH6
MNNFNIYDPMKKGQGLVLDGQSLAHIEVLLNSEGTEEGSLLQLLSRCVTPFGQPYSLSRPHHFSNSCFRKAVVPHLVVRALAQCRRYQCPVNHFYPISWFIELNSISRLDAVEDLMNHPTFEGDFMEVAKGLPDLERIVSRIHAKNCKVKDFLKVLKVRSLWPFSSLVNPLQ